MKEYISKRDLKKFIDLVCQHPLLYDQSAKNSDWETTKAVWDKITSEMNIPTMCVTDWKSKWKCLRDQYVKKRKGARNADSEEMAEKAMSWKFYNDMSFLGPFVDRAYHKPYNRIPKTNGMEYQHYTIIKSEDYDELDEENTEEYSTFSYSKESSGEAPSPSAASDERTKRKRRAPPNLAEYDRDVSPAKDGDDVEDNDSWSCEGGSQSRSFFQSCALRMDKLPERLQSYLQLQISQLFFNAENPDVPAIPIMPLPTATASSSSSSPPHSMLPPSSSS